MKALFIFTLFLLSTPINAKDGEADAKRNRPNLIWGHTQLIHENEDTGFAIYRTSRPKRRDIRELCEMGVEEMMVLSGDAEKYEVKYKEECPTLKVVYNEEQDVKHPVDNTFLEKFDDWVADAKANGKKIAFRCTCGCHRTGRLAAYYQMKYMELTSKDATELMMAHGKWMFLYPMLKKQVLALEDWIKERPCSQREKHCVIEY